MTSAANWKKPLKWDREAKEEGRRRVVFCASLADVFEDWTGPIVNSKGETIQTCESDCGYIQTDPGICQGCDFGAVQPATMSDIRAMLFCNLIKRTPNLIWRILTKRPENIRRFWPYYAFSGNREMVKNVHLYASVENQQQADKRLPELMKCQGMVPVLGISAEPLLEQVDVSAYLGPLLINHVIVGGESGPDSRPFCSSWAAELLNQCANAGVPFFMKQFGSKPYVFLGQEYESRLAFNDSKGGDPDEWLPMYRVRNVPEIFYSL